jgi:flavin reductase (DIM6/NTAB) family NADH-FMN oxidoreductase RutF
MFSSGGHKDSLRNVEETGEFVCSFVTYDLREQMNVSSAQVGPDVDEFELAGLAQAPSRMVKPPRVAESPAALECKHYKTIELPGLNGGEGSFVVLGEVVGIYIDDDAIVDGLFDLAKLRPIARLGYMDYAVVDNIFSMDRPD